jgi:hypothetical protein
MWSLPIIPGETDKHFYEYSYFSSDDNVIALLGQYYKRKTFISDHLALFNTKTGEKIALTSLSDEKYDYDYSFAKIIDGKIYIMGEYYKKMEGSLQNRSL